MASRVRWMMLGLFVMSPALADQPSVMVESRVLGIPMNLLVNADGVIVERYMRGDHLLTELSELLAGG